MKHRVHFTKMHGAGNDYIYVDTMSCCVAEPRKVAILMSDRHKGVGSDGLVLIGKSTEPSADFTMRIYNADGSEAMMCGNATRCVGKYLYEKKYTSQTLIRLLTLSGVRSIGLHLASPERVDNVTVDMGVPIFDNHKQFVSSSEVLPEGVFVSMGNPHYVIFVEDVDAIDVAAVGASLEWHTAFPERCNIEFAQVVSSGVRVRVWERGSGITMACGTGACATAVAAYKSGIAGRSSRIIMDGGSLDIEWRQADNHVYMTGGAEFVFEGDMDVDI